MQKGSKAKSRPPTLTNSLKVKAGPTAMQKVLKQNLHKIVIYVNKPRPAARDCSQSTASEECKQFFNNYQHYNHHDMSTSASTAMHETCINIRTMHPPITQVNKNNLIIQTMQTLLFYYE